MKLKELRQLIREELQLLTESTGAIILVPDPKQNKYVATICSFDGYPNNMGRILQRHWKNPAKIKQLVKLGKNGIVSLGKTIGNKVDTENSQDDDEKVISKSQCEFYGRDRGETRIRQWWLPNEWKTKLSSIKSITKAEYAYVYDAKTKSWTGYKLSPFKEVVIPA